MTSTSYLFNALCLVSCLQQFPDSTGSCNLSILLHFHYQTSFLISFSYCHQFNGSSLQLRPCTHTQLSYFSLPLPYSSNKTMNLIKPKSLSTLYQSWEVNIIGENSTHPYGLMSYESHDHILQVGPSAQQVCSVSLYLSLHTLLDDCFTSFLFFLNLQLPSLPLPALFHEDNTNS